MKTINGEYVTVREAVAKQLLSEKESVFAIYLLTIIVKKMLYDSDGGGHFNINPETVLIKKNGTEPVETKLLGYEKAHEACNGKPDFDTKALNNCFRAPETFLGRFSPASDVYSIGVLLAYMLQGRFPFDVNESMPKEEILKVIKESNPVIDTSDSIKSIISKAISKKTTERYKNVEELELPLMNFLGMEKLKKYTCFSNENKREILTETGEKRRKDSNYIINDDKKDVIQSPQVPKFEANIEEKKGEGFKAVAGMEDIKKILRRDFIEIVSHRELAKEFGVMPSNFLFFGAPGTGKTYLGKRLAEESGLCFCYVKPSDMGSIWIHGTQGMIKDLFQKAEAKAKQNKKGCILLIDELDALCGSRTEKTTEHQADEVAEWLTQLNDCVEKNVFVIGTTNCLDRVDSALTRHGRIDQIIYVGLPDMDCRRQLFDIELRNRPHEAEINIEELAKMTEGYTSSDISYIVKETARNAFEASINKENSSVVKISESMLKDVIHKTRPSVTREDMRRYEKMRDDYIKQSKNERPRIGFLA